MQRRDFLLSAASAGRILGANDRVRLGLIGCGGRGRYVGGFMKRAPHTGFAAVCDVYRRNAEAAREWAGPEARAYTDFRRLLEQRDVDAVLIATPDHWHAIPTVLACQAGKHVYVEKPLTHNVREGRAMVDAARRYGRLVLAGIQHRSASHYAEVAHVIQSGELGQVRFVRVWNYVNRAPAGVGKPPDGDPPPGLDWDFYLGPAPRVPFNPARFLGTYRWFADYSGGFITDYGTHRFDTVHQVMGVDTPQTVAAAGGKFLDDLSDLPDLLQVTYEYPGFLLSYEACTLNGHGCGGRTPNMRYYNAVGADDRPHGEAYYGTSGTLICDRIGYEIYPEPKAKGSPEFRMAARRKNTLDATADHALHFVACIRGLDRPRADVAVGHQGTIVPHLGNIAYRTGRKLKWDGAKEEFIDAPEANRLLSRQARRPWDLI